jgi:glycerophosphoryl diester phosphodiesterase
VSVNLFEKALNTTANYYWGLNSRSPSLEQKKSAKLVAHRGVHENGLAIENTLKAFDLAVENKIWGIEFDVRFTKDNVPVIHHDDSLERVFKKSELKISQLNYAELRSQLPEIPSLSEMVHRYGGKIKLLVEVKEPEGYHLMPDNFTALENTLSLIRAREDYYLLTLNPSLYKNVDFIDKRAVMCVDWMNMDETLEQALALGYGAISGHFMLMNDKRLKLSKEKNLITGTGFIETKGALYRELSRGVDWIFTNHPLRLKKYLET